MTLNLKIQITAVPAINFSDAELCAIHSSLNKLNSRQILYSCRDHQSMIRRIGYSINIKAETIRFEISKRIDL
jgi:predicted transcriptional regulator